MWGTEDRHWLCDARQDGLFGSQAQAKREVYAQ